MNWEDFPNFPRAEMACKHTGKCEMHPVFMQRLQHLRNLYGKPMRVTSGYRDKTHPAERGKTVSGAHSLGRAVDVAVSGPEALTLLRLALPLGFTGIGIKQHGEGRFLHLDDVPNGELPRPTLWSYP